MRRTRLVLLAIASSALVVAGCSSAPEPADAPTGSPTAAPSDPGTPTPPEMLSYPDQPSTLWTFSADDAGVTGTEVYLIDPAQLGALGNGIDASRPVIDAGEAWITAATGRDVLPVLIGLSPASGEALWTYRPEDAVLGSCARPLVRGTLACLTSGPLDSPSRTDGVVLVDPVTGEESGGFTLPSIMDFTTGTIAVSGSDVLVLMPADPDFDPDEDGWPGVYRVDRYTTDGDAVWSTEVSLPAEIPAMGPTESLEPGRALVAAKAIVSLWVLDLDDGALLHEREGSWTPTADGGGLVYTGSGLEVVAADGTIVAELPGYQQVLPLVSDAATPVLMDPDGVLVELDAAAGEPRSPGIPNPWNEDQGRPLSPAGVSLFGRTMVMTDPYAEGLYGYDLDDPTAPPWHREGATAYGTFTDGTRLFTTAQEGIDPADGFDLVAVSVDDGSVAWTLPVPSSDAVSWDLRRADGHLALAQGPTITVLAP